MTVIETTIEREHETAALLDRIAALEARIAALEAHPAQGIEDRLAMVVFSGDLDKVIAALIIATGAASMGLENFDVLHLLGLECGQETKGVRREEYAGTGIYRHAARRFGADGAVADELLWRRRADHSQIDARPWRDVGRGTVRLGA